MIAKPKRKSKSKRKSKAKRTRLTARKSKTPRKASRKKGTTKKTAAKRTAVKSSAAKKKTLKSATAKPGKRRAPGTSRFLCGSGLHDVRTAGWASRTRIVTVSDWSDREPTTHDAAVSVLMSSIEIEIRRSKSLRFATHLDVIKNASAQAQDSDTPLSIPIGQLAHTFAGGKTVSLKNAHVKPDALFGIGYLPQHDPDYRFFAVEYDRGTEDVEPSGNLARASWLRKVLSYSAISSGAQPIYHIRRTSGYRHSQSCVSFPTRPGW